jgi:hypothetical protein
MVCGRGVADRRALRALSIFIYNQLSHWYRPVHLTVTSNGLGTGQQVTLGSTGSAVQWSAVGFVGQLTVVGAGQGAAEIMLPVPVSRCPAVTAKLGVACGGSGLLLPPSVEFSWSPPQLLSTGQEMASVLDITPSPSGAHSTPSVIVSLTTSNRPTLCLSSVNRSTLTITVGQRHYMQVFSGFMPCDGVAAVMGSRGSNPSSFEFDTIDGLTVDASSRTGTLQGFTSQITLTPGGTSVQGSGTAVSLRSAAAGLSATLGDKPGSQSLTVTSTAAASVMTGAGELVPSEWARETVVFGPLLGGFVTALVVTPLGVSLGVLTDALKRWPGPRRRGRKSPDREARREP